MKLKKTNVDELHSESGLFVIFPRAELHILANRMMVDVDDLIKRYHGQMLPRLDMDGGNPIDVLTAVNLDGSQNEVVTFGAKKNLLRFLKVDEKPFSEWVKTHPKYSDVHEGTDKFDEVLWNELMLEYRTQLIKVQ